MSLFIDLNFVRRRRRLSSVSVLPSSVEASTLYVLLDVICL